MTLDDIERIKRSVYRNYPVMARMALNNVNIRLGDDVSTAAVMAEEDENGNLVVKEIVLNPEFFDRLKYSERVFVLAHEMCHIALKHFSRSADAPERVIRERYEKYCEKEVDERKRKMAKTILHNKYHRMWNIATDACINAFLKRDGLTFPTDVIDPKTGEKMQFIYMTEGLFKSAEKIFDALVKKDDIKQEEKKKKEEEKQKDESESSDSNEEMSNDGGGESYVDDDNNADGGDYGDLDLDDLDDIDIDNYKGIDSHDGWSKNRVVKDADELDEDENTDTDTMDSSSFDEEETIESELRSREQKTTSFPKRPSGSGLGNIGRVPQAVSWKEILVGTMESTRTVWGYRRATRDYPNARLEDRSYDDIPQRVEVILDSSGSISSSLLKGFLLQIYSLFEAIGDNEIDLEVGCFSTMFSGFEKISKKEDIIKFYPKVSGGTDFEVAATSFTKDYSGTNIKIVFTDGVLGTPQVTRDENILWVVFGDRMNFEPVGGRVVRVSKEECDKMISSLSSIVENTSQVHK